MPRADLLQWRQASWLAEGALCHVQQAFYPPGYAFPRHRHDYAECFLVQRGRGRHLLPDGEAPLGVGDLVFVHPDTEHALAAAPDSPLVFLNVALQPRMFAALARRYARDAAGRTWPWARSPRPRGCRLAGHELAMALDDAHRLMRPGAERDPLLVDAFMLWALARVDGPPVDGGLPAALAQAVAALESDPLLLAGGVAAIARRAGCSRVWASRLIRRHTGTTPRALVARARLDAAARALRATADPIPEVAAACGFPNLSNFYRLFGRRFRCTPARWRAARGGGFV